MFIDTHCHLSYDDYDDISLVIKDNVEAGIDKMIISGCTRSSIEESIKITEEYKNIYLTIGYHPSEARFTNTDDLKYLEEQIKSNKKIVGIGEIGLDYRYGKEDIVEQKELFEKQLKLAEKYNLPVVIHTRDATFDTIEILKKYPRVRGDIHCFSGSVETARIYISFGYMLGIGGVLTFKNSNLYKVVENVGLDHIILETDSPYLTPVPHRGEKNSSKYIPLIAKRIAEILDVSIEEVSKKTLANTYKLFDFK